MIKCQREPREAGAGFLCNPALANNGKRNRWRGVTRVEDNGEPLYQFKTLVRKRAGAIFGLQDFRVRIIVAFTGVSLIKENTVTLSKKNLAALLLFCGGSAMAQNSAAMDETQLQGMMQGAAQMAACFQNLDQDKLNALAEEGKVMQSELKQLCAAGERDQAQAKAMEYGLKFMNSDEFKQLQQCGEMAKQMMPQMPDYTKYADPDSEENVNRHVCDEL